jgi:hypothetical protein
MEGSMEAWKHGSIVSWCGLTSHDDKPSLVCLCCADVRLCKFKLCWNVEVEGLQGHTRFLANHVTVASISPAGAVTSCSRSVLLPLLYHDYNNHNDFSPPQAN